MPGNDIGRVILDILIVLIAAKIGGEIAERLRQPAVLGELALGVIVGPSLLGWIEPTPVLVALAQLGAILLLFEVGLETDLAGVLRVGGVALRVAAVGVAVPFLLGGAIAAASGHAGAVAVYVGATLTATSVGITARLLSDTRKLDTDEGRTILGAAVADDVIGLLILTVVSAVATGAAVSGAFLARTTAGAVAFLAAALLLGIRASPPVFRWIAQRVRVRGVLITAAFSFCLVFAYTAEVLGLAPIVGAFGAGLVLARTEQHEQIRERLAPLADIFIPIFFLSMGVLIDASVLGRPALLWLAVLLTVAGAAGKVVSGIAAPSSMSRLAVGVGMIPRGEVGFIFASVGLAAGVIGPDLYAALLLMVAGTTFLTPPLARPLFERLRPARGREPGRLVLPRRPLGSIRLGPRW